ncbi:mechanosensitive ion channel domain-containing protein [Halobacteriaceae archaeon GCM10025711]
MAIDWRVVLVEQSQYALALVVLVTGLVSGYLIGKLNKRILVAVGVPGAVEGTTVERTFRSIGTSTVTVFARLSSWFIYGFTIVATLHFAGLMNATDLWMRTTGFIPDLFLAVIALALGFVVGDKAKLTVSEYLRGVKLPEIGIVPRVVKYSIVYLAALVALGQIGIAVEALIVLFAAYVVALILFGALAFKDLLAAGAAGIYLLLNQPYGIGDNVEIGRRKGIVQEVTVFVTHVEDDGKEYIVPNHLVFREGVVRVRS